MGGGGADGGERVEGHGDQVDWWGGFGGSGGGEDVVDDGLAFCEVSDREEESRACGVESAGGFRADSGGCSL